MIGCSTSDAQPARPGSVTGGPVTGIGAGFCDIRTGCWGCDAGGCGIGSGSLSGYENGAVWGGNRGRMFGDTV